MISLMQSQFYRLEDYLITGGVVMLPLVVLSLVMWLLIVNRTLFFRRLHLKNG
jgi:biopolymer transport protein ExbB